MKKSTAFLGTIILTLIAVSLVAPIETSFGHVAISNSFTPKGTTSLIVESQHDFSSEEVLFLSGFGTVTTVAGPVAVLHTRMKNLASLAHLPFVSRITRSHPLSIYLDKSVPDIGADMVWGEVKDPYGKNATGAGIVIGIVDTGIDTRHPDFSFPNGTTKILYVWDQTTLGRPPTGFGYGYECNSNDIQAKTCPEVDSFGHGTHVAGIAASSGLATGNYTGVAPGAAIIFVKSGYELCNGSSWNFDSSQILDGINYIVKKAAQIGRRAVISLSLGGNVGSHDGTDPLELGLDAFVKAGTPIVVAAGNEAQSGGHVRGQLSQGVTVTFRIGVRQTTTGLQIDVWYSTRDEFEATLTTPDGDTYTIPTPLGGAPSNYGNITTLASSTGLGKELYLEVNSTIPLPPEGWSVTLKANRVNSQGFWDAWVDAVTCSFPGAFFVPGKEYTIDPYDTIGIPGTARYVVTAGAYVTKSSWRGLNGQTFGSPEAPTGEIAPFSSLGPTRDGRIKPDVVAPGILIASARSSAIPSRGSDPDVFHRILAGTSMAAPHVAGAIALMLQYAPGLEATEFSRIIRQTARLDANTGFLTSGSPVWGYGKIDTRSATGLYRITLITKGIPKSVNASVHIDDKKTFTVTGDSWTALYFLKGTTHTVAFDKELQGRTGTRYELEDGQFIVTLTSIKVVNYRVQYLLTVNSQYGPTTGSGWYTENATVKIDAPKRVTAPDFPGYLGAEYVLVYWVTEDGKVVTESVTMDKPKSVTAIYVVTYPIQTIAATAIVTVIGVVTVIMLAQRRNAGAE